MLDSGGLTTSECPEVRRFEHAGGWLVSIHLHSATPEAYIAGYADLQHKGEHKCRIVLAGRFSDPWVAANSLQTGAIEWVDDWNSRSHKGDSGFTDL